MKEVDKNIYLLVVVRSSDGKPVAAAVLKKETGMEDGYRRRFVQLGTFFEIAADGNQGELKRVYDQAENELLPTEVLTAGLEHKEALRRYWQVVGERTGYGDAASAQA